MQGGYAILYLMPWIVGRHLREGDAVGVAGALERARRTSRTWRAFFYRQPLGENERALPMWVSAAFVALLVGGSLALLRKRLSAVEVVAS